MQTNADTTPTWVAMITIAKEVAKMVMTEKLANQLMDSLACVAISANGIPKTEEQFEKVSEYARNTFMSILGAWEELKGEEWEIEEAE